MILFLCAAIATVEYLQILVFTTVAMFGLAQSVGDSRVWYTCVVEVQLTMDIRRSDRRISRYACGVFVRDLVVVIVMHSA